MANETLKKQWADKFQCLVGRKITQVRWMTVEDASAAGWDSGSIMLQLDDGTLLWPSADDEGNNAGALFTQEGDLTKGLEPIAPVI